MKNKSLIHIIQTKLPDRAKYKRTPWRFWPSEASCIKTDGTIIGKCIRNVYYQWKNLPESNPVSERVKLLGKIGHFVEYETRKDLLSKNVYPKEFNKKDSRKFRVPIAEDIILSGEVDIIAGNTKEHCGMEIKNYSNSTYQLKNKPKDPHLLQTFLYVVYFKPEQPYFLIKYCPSMVSKYATQEVYHRIDWIEIEKEIYPVINGGIDKEIKLSSIIKRFKESKYYIKNGILPKREFTKSTKHCKQCPYKDYCWKDSDGSNIEDSIMQK